MKLIDDLGVVATGEEAVNDAIENLEPNGSFVIIQNSDEPADTAETTTE